MSESSNSHDARTLRSIGITMIGIVASIGATVGFGIPGPWWVRVGAGLLTAVALSFAIKVSTAESSRGPLTKFANWITGTNE